MSGDGRNGGPVEPQVLARAPRMTMALLHVASNPEASNREIAAGIGIAGDAQISRLLARMQDLGLVSNHSRASGGGGANSWRLTPDGARVVSALKESLA